MKQKLIWLASVAASLLCIILGNRVAVQGLASFSGTEAASVEKVRVVEILSKETVKPEYAGMPGDNVNIRFRAVVLSGIHKGEELEAMQLINPMQPLPIKEARPGVKFLVTKDQSGVYDADTWYASQDVRSDALIGLGLFFAVCLLLFGRFKGFDTILSLGFTCSAIFLVLIPAILSGKNVYVWSLSVCSYIVAMTLLIVTRANMKSLGAGLGCAGGILASGGLMLLMSHIMGLTGMVDEESYYLQFLNGENPIDMKAIIFAAIVIGAIGAVMDVAVSVATSLYEVRRNTEHPDFFQIVKSGFSIGQDMIGTMANTLVLAYIGSSLSTVLLLAAYNRSILSLLNREMIVVEILQALIGSLGILLTIPLTSVACGFLYAGKPRLKKFRGPKTQERDRVAAADDYGGLTQYDSLRDKFPGLEGKDGSSD